MKGIRDLFSQISANQNNSNDAQLSKISTLLTTGDFPKFKRRSNEEQFEQNSKVLRKLDEAEKSLKSMNVDKVRDNIIVGIWLIISYFSLTVLKLFSYVSAF